jgi:hypothetical protein
MGSREQRNNRQSENCEAGGSKIFETFRFIHISALLIRIRARSAIIRS